MTLVYVRELAVEMSRAVRGSEYEFRFRDVLVHYGDVSCTDGGSYKVRVFLK